MRFVRKVNEDSVATSPEDIRALNEIGFSDEAIYYAITVCALFNFYNRWIDASGVHAMSDAAHAVGAGTDLPTWLNGIRDRISAGIDPMYVGELVREGIEGDWPYIFTDNEFEPFIDARFAAIKAGFDQVRGRTPKR